MNQATDLLCSYVDFSCFSKSNNQQKTNLCTIKNAQWVQHNEMILFTITSNLFLRGMVRAIVGTIIQVGSNKMSVYRFFNVLEMGDRKEAGSSVPAHGLYLTKIEYLYLQSAPTPLTFFELIK